MHHQQQQQQHEQQQQQQHEQQQQQQHEQQQQRDTLAWSDYFLFIAIGFSIYSVIKNWNQYDCENPLHLFMLQDYIYILTFRGIYLLAIHFRNPSFTRCMVLTRVFFLLPYFLIWRIVGTVWVTESHDSDTCVDTTFFLAWLILGYIWLLFYISLLVLHIITYYSMPPELRNPAALNMQQPIVAQPVQVAGLSGQQLELLPAVYASSMESFNTGELTVCSICLEDIKGEDKIKVLPKCQHAFHGNCIDEWLIRSGNCPNCRSDIANNMILIHPNPLTR